MAFAFISLSPVDYHIGRPLALPVCCVLHRYGLHGVGWLWFGMAGRCPLRGVAGVAAVAVASVFGPVAKQQRNRPFKNPCLGLLPLQPCYSYFRYTCYT
jgi:hypothetical protein